MHKWLAPSSIHYLQMHRQLIVSDAAEEQAVDELSRKLLAQDLATKVPKIQVSEKDGQLFALNNSSLQLMRHLEKQGKLENGKIKVELVPLSKVPTNIQTAMVIETECQERCATLHQHNKPESSRSNTKKKDGQRSAKGGTGAECGSKKRTNDEESDPDEDEDEEDDDEEWGGDEVSSGSSESDEMLQCNVCDRLFKTCALLATHQLNKKHFGCSVCDTVFPSLVELQQHKESLEHWSDNDDNDDNEDNKTDDDNEQTITIVRPSAEEMERLL